MKVLHDYDFLVNLRYDPKYLILIIKIHIMKVLLIRLIECFFIIMLFNMVSCSSNHNEMKVINFESCISCEKEMKLSEIADTFEYLELKTPDNIVVSKIVSVLLPENFVLVQTFDGIYKFDRSGEFIREIGRKGQGPEEYLQIRALDVDLERKEIIQADAQKIIYYDYDGNFLRSTKIKDFFFNLVHDDTLFWTCNLCFHFDKNMAYALNQKGDTVVAVPNPNYGMESLNKDGFYFNSSIYLREFSCYGKNLYMKTRASRDTVYQISGKNVVPYMYIDLGSYKMPVEYEIWYSKEAYEKNAENYWSIPRFDEDNRFIYLVASRQKHRNKERDNEEDYKFIIFDKKKKEGFVTKSKYGNKITDDILGGPSFWPMWKSGNYYIDAIEWSEFVDKMEIYDYPISLDLRKISNDWNEDTNQIIRLAYIKD